MAAKGKKRKILRGLGWGFGGMFLFLVAMPVWFRWAAPPLFHPFGIHYASYHRVGYGRFILRDVSFTNATTHFRAKTVETFVPTVWLWRRWRAHESVTFLQVENWNLDFHKRAK